MSRKGKIPVLVPSNVKVELAETKICVEGPIGKLCESFNPMVVKVRKQDASIIVEPADDSRLSKAMHGTLRSIIANMVLGVQKPYFKDLEISGVGFKAVLNGKVIDLALGYSYPIKYEIPQGIQITIQENTKIHIEGANKKLVGQVAADIKNYYPVEPYKGKGVRVVGEFVRRKEGKKTA